MRGKGVEILRCRPNPESPPAIFVSPLAQTGGCAREGDAANRLRAALRVWPHDALWPRLRPRATRLALLPARPPTPATRRCDGPGGHPLRPVPRGAPEGIAPIYTRAFSTGGGVAALSKELREVCLGLAALRRKS